AIVAARELLMPLARGVFVLDLAGFAGNALLGRGPRGGLVGRLPRREPLGKNVADLIGPTAVVLDDLVGDVGHVLASPYETIPSSRRVRQRGFEARNQLVGTQSRSMVVNVGDDDQFVRARLLDERIQACPHRL